MSSLEGRPKPTHGERDVWKAPHEWPACNLCGGTAVRLVREPNFVECAACRLRFCIVALDYIEHTYHPNEDLAKANAMLNPGGVLALKTFLEELDPGMTMVEYPWHSYHFFGDVLHRMITQNDFSIVHWEIDASNQVFLVARKQDIPDYYKRKNNDGVANAKREAR